jgi:hypothetical protein
MSVAMKPGDGVDRDIADAHLLRQGLGEPDEPGLRRHVVRLPGVPCPSHHGRDVDDASPARLHHARQHLLGGEESPREVDLEHQVPVLRLHPDRQAVARDAGVIHQDVDALELLEGDPEGLLDGDRGAKVQVDRDRLAAQCADLLRHLLVQFNFGEATTMSLPSLASASAVALPMPRLDPVTNAVRFAMFLLNKPHHSRAASSVPR